MTNIHETDFPYEEIKESNGDYFFSPEAAQKAGFNLNQIWSVAEEDNVFTYGPHYHRINVIGYVATQETHDSDTYYIEDESDEFE